MVGWVILISMVRIIHVHGLVTTIVGYCRIRSVVLAKELTMFHYALCYYFCCDTMELYAERDVERIVLQL
jgi:hypothetical protein